MNQNLMALLTTVLSGQNQPLSGQPRPAPMPMQPQPAQPMMARGAQGGMLQMPGVRQNEHGNDGYVPGTGPGGNDTGPNTSTGNGHGGKAEDNRRLSAFERKMREIANKGPKAYTPAIKKNLGFGQPTIGYGKADPSSFKTGMADSLAGVLGSNPTPAPVADDGSLMPWQPK